MARSILRVIALELLRNISAPTIPQLKDDIATPLSYIHTASDLRLLFRDMERMVSSQDLQNDVHELVLVLLTATFPMISAVHLHLALPRYVQSIG